LGWVALQQNAGAVSQGNVAYFGDHQSVITVFGVIELTFPGQVLKIGFVVDTQRPALSPIRSGGVITDPP
jgi:hypothetical protein